MLLRWQCKDKKLNAIKTKTVTKKRKTKRKVFKPRSLRKKRKATRYLLTLMGVLKAAAVVCILAGIVIGLVFLKKDIKKRAAISEPAPVILLDAPDWANQHLKEKIYHAAKAYGGNLQLDETAAHSIQQNITREVAWLDEVKVQTAYDGFVVRARWRKPLALVKSGLNKCYVDSELVVIDFIEIANLPIVEVKGLSEKRLPLPGEIWQIDDLAAAVTILVKLNHMDNSITPAKPLLYEIDSIDVSNFNGRLNNRFAHIILYTKTNTEIIWGAEFGTWQRYLEAPDEEKLTKLYQYYEQFGSLSGGAKYIDLQYSQNDVSLPTDKY